MNAGRPAVRIGWLVAWLAATAVVSALCVRWLAPQVEPSDAATARPLTVSERAAVTLTTRTIQPMLTTQARVVALGDGGFALEAAVTDPEVAYRLIDPPFGVRALIDGGPAGFSCAWIGVAPLDSGEMGMRCRIPDDVRVVVGLSGKMALALAAPTEAAALPLEAVVGAAGRGEVVVIDATGATSVRSVELGRADTFWVEVTGGLGADERVLAAPVQADFTTARS